MKAKANIFISSTILVLCLLPIATGSPILNEPLFGSSILPAGTLISWIGIIALTVTIYFVFNQMHSSNGSNNKIFRLIFKSIIVLASIWGFVGFLLADNWTFTFKNHNQFRGGTEASGYFWIFTASLLLFPILLILVYSIFSLLKKLLKSSGTND